MKALIVAEKPSVGRDIARVLKCSKKGDGFLYNDEYVVSWAIGHLVTLCDPEDYDESLKKWRMETLPIIPAEIKTKAIANTKAQLNILKKLMDSKEVDRLICATDSGREGELIFRYIYDLLKCKKPFKRLWISSMTDTAIKDGFDTLKDGSEYDNLYMSAKCRSEADWLVGINASRAFTLKYNALLSIGRVQTPTLAILVERQKEIDKFQSKEYWEIEGQFADYKGIWTDIKKNDTKIEDKKRAEEIVNLVQGKKGQVESIENEEKKMPPPLLYDLTELQRDCNKKFGLSAKNTLGIVQDLYEKRKMVTYPRTDSRYLSDDMVPKLKGILQRLVQPEEYKKYAEFVLNLEKLPVTKRIVDNSKISDHHAIIPTDVPVRVDVLSDLEYKVYDLIARRFMAVFYPYYIYNTTKITTVVEGESFVTRGTTIIQKGWTELNRISDKEKKEEEILPNVKKGEEVVMEKATVLEKKTKPPQTYNEATLLSAMENAGRFVEDEELKEQLKDSGLGTPATRAAIIERLIQVGYIVRKGKSLIPTDKGMKLIAVVPNELKSPETTGKWEKALTSVAKGKMADEKFMGSILRYVNYLVEQSRKMSNTVIFDDENYKPKSKGKAMGKCLACNGEILENSKSFYCSNWKQGCKFTIWKNSLDTYSGVVDAKIVKKLLKDGIVKDVDMILPQTNEKCKAELVFKEDKSGKLEYRNVKRI